MNNWKAARFYNWTYRFIVLWSFRVNLTVFIFETTCFRKKKRLDVILEQVH